MAKHLERARLGFSRVKVIQSEENPAFNQIFVDDVEVKGVTEFSLDLAADTWPYAKIKVNSLCAINEIAKVEYSVIAQSVEDAKKTLRLAYQLDGEFRESFASAIYSALVEVQSENGLCDYDKARRIADKVLGGL